jgi:cytosine/adenosine deaminase-related metal-dependent hydrolase
MSSGHIIARYGLPIDGPPLTPCRVRYEDGVITQIDSPPSASVPEELENAVIVPGLINSHTHLEFSRLAAPLGRKGISFVDWIREIINWRVTSDPTDAERQQACIDGLAESQQHGVACLGEICTSAAGSEAIFASAGVEGTVFRELLGLSLAKEEGLLQLADRFLATASATTWRAGLTPHAPYTVGPSCLKKLVHRHRHVPFAMHLAETVEELELLRAHSGPLYEFLGEIDAWEAAALPRGISPVDYLTLLSAADRSLVIHGNYLDSEAIHVLAQHHDRMTVVYCPRTHSHFEHGNYPLEDFLSADVRVSIGTDSRASNPDLSILAELKHVAARHPSIAPSRLLELATINGAWALAREATHGSLKVGKSAVLTIIDLTNCPGDDLYERVLSEPSRVVSHHV